MVSVLDEPPASALAAAVLAVCALMALAGCAAYAEPGAPARPFATPRTIFLTIDSPAQIALLPKSGWADDAGGKTVGLTRMFPAGADGKPGACFVTVPPPLNPDDLRTWRVWFHEIMRHCNGQLHDDRGVWLP